MKRRFLYFIDHSTSGQRFIFGYVCGLVFMTLVWALEKLL